MENTTIVSSPESEYIIDVDHLTIRFNKATEKIDNLKEYFVKLVKHELMFQEFLALKDVSLKVKKGEAWAIIGTNGSGKSTILKAISKILKPYKGTVTVNGTIASLIELSAGIDPKLTARENIYLNGCILGHTKKFIDEKFDEIVEFSELEDFLDSPVKNFSSGMKSRLGFSVATMVEPDILIVDEVLSVGDVLFRKKCMNKMNEMLNNGTTLLFVSHNMNTVRSMCDKALWLNKGEVVMQGDIKEVCDEYEATIGEKKAKEKAEKDKKARELKKQAQEIAAKKKKRTLGG
ncbi:MAG: ABC transporter ATP-binding protein [Ruminococcus sp.]|nr:ABC transporter ATP-binding protein [Ruminococcus sp.]